MRSHATINGSELLLSIIAIRLAVLVLVGWILTLLPRETHDRESACAPAPRLEVQSSVKTPRVADAALEDMRLHD